MRKPAVLLFVAMVCVALPLAAQESKAPVKSGAKAHTKAGGEAAAPAAFDQALLRPAALAEQAPGVYEAKFTTTKGDFVVKVTRAWAPLGADRFYNLVKHHFYDGASLFRVVPGFVVQFGISAHSQVSQAWQSAVIKDDPVKQSNKRGFVTFATGGPNTRTTQVFVNLSDRNAALDSQGFAPFGEVSQGMDIVEQLYSGYGEGVTDKQAQISAQGNAYLEKHYPKLDKVTTATLLVPAAPATATATKKAPAKKQ